MSLFDKELALHQAGGNAELAIELFEMLVKDLPNSQQAIQTAHANKDKSALWDAVHKVHGGTAYCGVPDLKDACKALEDEIKNAYPVESIQQPLDEVSKQMNLLLNNADSFIKSISK